MTNQRLFVIEVIARLLFIKSGRIVNRSVLRQKDLGPNGTRTSVCKGPGEMQYRNRKSSQNFSLIVSSGMSKFRTNALLTCPLRFFSTVSLRST